MSKFIEEEHDISHSCPFEEAGNFLVQKSTPLLSLWQSPLTLAEFKILDAYLSRINSHDPSHRRVRFEKGELEDLLDVTKINLKDLEARIQHLGVMIKIVDQENGFTSIALFEEAVCRLDEHGQWQIDLQCTQQAMKYIFNIDNLGYLRYRLRSVVSLKSRYSYLLFLYLEQNRFRSPWEVSVSELRQILGCTSEFYQSYAEFNKNVLRRCRNELLTKTSCKFKYTPIRKGRSVYRLRFDLEPISEILDSSESYSCSSKSSEIHGKDFLTLALCKPGCDTTEFTKAQIAEIFSCLSCVPLSKLPHGPGCVGITMQWYHYLSTKFTELNRRAETNVIHSRYSYLIAMIKADCI